MMAKSSFFNNKSLRSATIGGVLGLGAPAGYAIFSYVFLNPSSLPWMEWITSLVQNQTMLMSYLTVPTVLVFATFGYVHGKIESKLAFKNSQMQHFLSIAAHDIKSPLAVLQDGSLLLQEESAGPVNEKQKKLLGMMHKQSLMANELITEILDIHKMESNQHELQLKPVSLRQLIDRSIDDMRVQIDSKEFQVKVVDHLNEDQRVMGDAFRIRQVIRNIISNAVKYTPEKGTIEFIAKVNEEGNVDISIINSGDPIPPDRLKGIFNKFYQASHRDHKLGHGLGLAICKNIMELHNGGIRVENLEPTGVAFYLTFPNLIKDA